MNGSGHPIDDKYASTRTALKELPLGGLLLDRCPSSGNGLIKMVSWKMYQNGEQELHHLTGHRRLLVSSAPDREHKTGLTPWKDLDLTWKSLSEAAANLKVG